MGKSGNDAAKILGILKKTYPDAHCELDFSNPLELLVATILSAQCTDARVNIVTKTLFKKYRKAEDYREVAPSELEKDIRTTGFYKNKAKSIQGACKILVEKYGGKVPKTLEELVELPGVAMLGLGIFGWLPLTKSFLAVRQGLRRRK